MDFYNVENELTVGNLQTFQVSIIAFLNDNFYYFSKNYVKLLKVV